jgi:hypothetical protein
MTTVGSEWRRLWLTCAVLVPLLTVLQHSLLGYSWPEAFFGGVTYSVGVGFGIWLFRIRPRNSASG